QALRAFAQVHVSYPRDLEGLLGYLAELGVMLGEPAAACDAIDRIERAARAFVRPARPPRVLYLIWREPWMAAGPDTFIDGMLRECGFENVLRQGASRYPEVELA